MMTGQGWFRVAMVACALTIAAPGRAQTTVSSSEIQRLQDEVYQASGEISRMRSSDTSEASRLQGQLDDLREEVVYLKVKLRKEGSVSSSEYQDVRSRLQDLRYRARGETPIAGSNRGTWGPPPTGTYGGTSGGVSGGVAGGTSAGTSGGTTGGYGDARDTRDHRTQTGGRSAIPAGQELDVRLTNQLSSDTAQVEDRFEATTVVDLYQGNTVLVPSGSVLRGVVSSVSKASRTDRKGSMTVSFDQITVRGRTYPMRGTVTQAIESEGIKGEAGRIGAGAGVGAIIGGIIGGVKGALLGVLIGGGGTIAATEGKDVTLPAGTILRVRLDTPPEIR
jgi:TolA-binding protein